MSASQHATSQLEELVSGLTSNPGLYQPDTHSHAYLWQEDQIGSVASGQTGYGEINTLSLKAKSCTPTVYRYEYVCEEVVSVIVVCIEMPPPVASLPGPLSLG